MKRPVLSIVRLTATALLLAAISASPAEVREIVVTNNLMLERGAALGTRLIVRGSHLIIDGQGATLQGSGLGIALDSWGADPFTVWIDGLTVAD